MSSDTRKAPRVAAPHIMVKVSSPERFRTAYLKDLSEGGLFIKTEKPLPVGTAVCVDLLPPGWADSLRLKGNVVRIESEAGKSGMGVKLDGNEPEASDKLKLLVAEYQAGTAPAIPPAGQDEQVKGLLVQLSELKNTLAQRDKELATERGRREALTTELATLREAGGPRESEGQLEAELAAAQAELSELRTRAAELEGERDAYRQELDVLEKDDATSRRLAAALAKEKTDLTAEVTRLKRRVDELAEQSQNASAEHEARARALESDLQSASARAQEELAQLRQTNAELEAKKEALAEELAGAKTEIGNLTRRLASAEATAKDAAAKVEKARAKERELRELMEMVAAKNGGDDVVVVAEPGAAEAAESPVEEPVTELEAAASVPFEAQSPAPPAPEAPDEPLGAPSDAELSFELEAAAPTASESPDLSVDVEVDTGDDGEALDPAQRASFESRVRSNEPLVKRERFSSHVPRNPRQEIVIGLLEATARFPELMVLGRGRLTPPELLDTLFELFQDEVVGFPPN